MLFNSIDFAIFLPVVFVLYWFVLNKDLRQQNVLLVVASYVFYGWWDWRFLSLILFSTIIDYTVGRLLRTEEDLGKRKVLLWISILVNLGFLGFFKYYNFFLDNFMTAFSFFGADIKAGSLNIILPVGISFYTFQTLSYTIDVYKKRLKPSKDFIAFSAFVSFFPQLVAGPIERATNLLPQFFTKRRFDYDNAIHGLTQIVWGLFKKVVIADSCAVVVNQIFDSYDTCSGSTLVLGAIFFAFQIYGDFSGYSDIAIGTSKLFGFNLKKNFDLPYFSRNIAEFWRRWHISLNTWFRDYVYIPLGGSRLGRSKMIKNVLIVFIISGLWHGANWTFLVWGFLNAIYFLPLVLNGNNRKYMDTAAKGRFLPSIKEILQIGMTFGLTVFAWIFFRAESVSMAFDYISIIFSPSILSMPYVFGIGMVKALLNIVFVVLMIGIEWFGREKDTPIYFGHKAEWIRWSVLFLVAIVIFLFGEQQQDFIYFQF